MVWEYEVNDMDKKSQREEKKEPSKMKCDERGRIMVVRETGVVKK